MYSKPIDMDEGYCKHIFILYLLLLLFLILQDDEDEDGEGNEDEGEGLSKSGKELKKLLGKRSANESDEEDDEYEDVCLLFSLECFDLSNKDRLCKVSCNTEALFPPFINWSK